MLEVTVTQPSVAEMAVLETEIRQAASDMMASMLETAKRVLASIQADIRKQLAGYAPPKLVIDRFPWFTPLSLANTYCSALQVQNKPEEIGLICNTDLLLKAQLPENLADILEYGTDITPMFPHLRAGAARLERELNELANRTNR